MWIPKEVVPFLLDAVLEVVRADEEDPNDLIILDGFVRPVLEEHRESGFDSVGMLDKGFGFMVGLIPGVLRRHRATMPPEQFGMLARIFHRRMIGRALERVEAVGDRWYEENLPHLYRDLDFVKLIEPARRA